MATNPSALDRPPMLPPDVSGQMGGGNPLAAIGGMMSQKPPGQDAPQPTGAITAQADAVEKVVSQMSRMSEAFAPFGAKILDTLKAGVAEATRAGQSGGGSQPTPQGSAVPAGAGAGFPG